MAPTPSGHLDFGGRPQQPTPIPNRTSLTTSTNATTTATTTTTTAIGDDGQFPIGGGQIPTPTATTASAPPPLAMDLDQSRVIPGTHLHHVQSAPTTLAYTRPGGEPAGPGTIDSTGAGAVAGIATMAGAGTHPHSHPHLSHAPLDWTLYNQPFGITSPAFNFQVPAISQPHPADPSLAYGTDLISPAHIHGQHSAHAGHTGHYGFAVPWDDGSGQDVSTPTLTSPVGPMSHNPWIDPDEAQVDSSNVAEDSRDHQGKRLKRHKKSARQGSDSTTGPPSTGETPTSPSSYSQNSRASLGSKSTSIASTSTNSNRQSKLRSASRTSKNSHHRPTDSPEERRTRASHNLVEKQYRNRLNAQFESLLNALPEQLRGGGEGDESDAPVNFEDKRVSKGEVLEMARKHIQTLERERNLLEKEKNELIENIQQLKGSNSDSLASSSATPIDFEIDMSENADTVEGSEDKDQDTGMGEGAKANAN